MITGSRLILSLLLLLVPVFSPLFYLLYLLAGLSDILDGIIARRTNSVSAFGSRLDTVADFVLVLVCVCKILPVLSVPAWLWIWTGMIAAVKIGSIIIGLRRSGHLAAVHSILNKVTGALLFLLPLALPQVSLPAAAVPVCFIASIAAYEENCLIRKCSM